MNDKFLHLDAEFTKATIGRLIAEYPELADDESLRMDAVEGETNAYRVIERAIEQRQEAEAMAGALKARIVDMTARHGRFLRKSAAMKHLISSIMRATNLNSLALPEASLTICTPKSSVGIESLDDLPQGFYRTVREPDRAAIKASIEAGEQVPGAHLVIGEPALMIRTK